jgi:hypothetical protein
MVFIIGISAFRSSVTNAAGGVPFKGWLKLSGGYTQVPYQDEIKLDPISGSFTIEGWIYNPFTFENYSTSHTAIYKSQGFGLFFDHWASPGPFPGKNTYSVGFGPCGDSVCAYSTHLLSQCDFFSSCQPQGWFHFAYVYNQTTNTGALFWNGQMLASNESIPNTSTEFLILKEVNSMDEFRISNNVRYTGSFTPAIAPFVCDENTMALWHFDEIEGSTIFHDACGGVDNAFVGYNGAHTEGVTGTRFYLPLVTR